MPTFSIKDYLYAGLLIILIGLFSYWTIHERDIGEAKIVAADQRTALVAQAKDKAIEAAAQAASNQIGTVYEKAVTVAPVGDLGVSCVRKSPGGGGVPQAAGSGSQDPGKAPLVGGQAPYDPTGAALTVGRDDDALIEALQDQVRDLITRMNGSTK